MPMTVVPSTVSEEMSTQYVASIKQYLPRLLDNHQDTMPTLRILKEGTQEMTVNPEEKFNIKMITGMQDSYGMTKDAIFTYKRLDPASAQVWDFHKFDSTAAMNDFDMVHYGNSSVSRIDLAEENVIQMRQALTWRTNWDLWSPWNDITASNLDVDLQVTLAALGHRNPPKGIIHYNAVGDRPFGIPTLIRKHVAAYPITTLGGISSLNTEFRSMVEDAPDLGYAPTRSIAGLNVGVVTNDHPDTSKLNEFSVEVLQDFLRRFQMGPAYELLCCLPGKHYDYLARTLENRIRDTRAATMLKADLGIDSTITFDMFNCTFYTDPLADLLFPYSLWFFDPQCLVMVMDEAFAPKVVPWEKISGTNQYGTVAYYNMQIINQDPVGTGAMHGWKVPA